MHSGVLPPLVELDVGLGHSLDLVDVLLNGDEVVELGIIDVRVSRCLKVSNDLSAHTICLELVENRVELQVVQGWVDFVCLDSVEERVGTDGVCDFENLVSLQVKLT